MYKVVKHTDKEGEYFVVHTIGKNGEIGPAATPYGDSLSQLREDLQEMVRSLGSPAYVSKVRRSRQDFISSSSSAD